MNFSINFWETLLTINCSRFNKYIVEDTKQASSSSKNVVENNQFLKPTSKPSENLLKQEITSRRKKNLSISYRPSYLLEMIKNLEELSTELESAEAIL